MDIFNGDEFGPEEEAWARWQLVDELATTGRCDEAVRVQRAFLDWARGVLPQDQLLWVMSSATHARCWVDVGLHEEWLDIFRELQSSLNRRSANRVERLGYLRTAGLVLVWLERRDDALRVAGMMRDLAKEDPGWERALWPLVEARVLELRIRQAVGDRGGLRREAEAIAALLEESGQSAVDPVTLSDLLAYVREILEDPSGSQE